MSFEEARAQFPVLERFAYLNAGTFGPLARSVADAIAAGLERDVVEGRSGLERFEETLQLRAELRESLARLVGADAEHLALTTSTTEACAIVLRGLGLTAEDEVVTTTDEHFGLLGPLAASPARVVVVPPDPERIVAAVTPRTKLLAVSEVLWTTGAVLPVSELRRQTHVPVLVDGAQSVGVVPTTAQDVDFLTISGQKWLCSPDGTGALVVRDPERLRVLSPSHLSQRRYEPDGRFEPQPGARRFETTWWPQGVVRGLLAALALRPSWCFERAAEAADRCRELLAPHVELVTPERRATLVSFRVDDDPTKLVARLHEAGVIVRELPGRGLVRASCGWWTSDEDLERLVAGVRAVVGR